MARRSLINTLLVPRIAALLEPLPAALAGENVAVHQARVGSRRLREVLTPMRGVLAAHAAERARDEVRRVTRALGPVRELDVAIALFDELAEAHGLAPAARLAVRRTMVRDRDAAQRRLRAALPPRRQERLAAALAALTGSIPWTAVRASWPRSTAAWRAVAGGCARRWSAPGRCTCPSGCTRCGSPSNSCGMRSRWPATRAAAEPRRG